MTGLNNFCPSNIVLCVVKVLLCLSAIMLNSIPIHAIRKTSSLQKISKIMLLSLAVSDLPPPTPPLLRLPFLLALFFLSLLSRFFCTWLLSLLFLVSSSLCFFQLKASQEGSANLFNVLDERLLQLLNPEREPLHESQ